MIPTSLHNQLVATVGETHALRLTALTEKLRPEERADAVAEFLKFITAKKGEVVSTLRYKTVPVSVAEFVTSKFYLGKGGEIYPEVLRCMTEMNSGQYSEAVLTGGIGSGKTTLALYSQAYQLYLLSCLRNPHAVFGLDESSEIKFVFQNISAKLAKAVDYSRFRHMIQTSPYFQRHFMFDQSLSSVLHFPNRIQVEPISGSETASIGQNVFGGIIDEVNYMAVIEKSKNSIDGGVYDQAVALYNSIARRRKSRFTRANTSLPGLLCIVSSKRYPGQFTDIKQEEAKNDPTIYIYDKRVWDIKPPGSFSETKFRVFGGDLTRRPRVLEEDEEIPYKDKELVVQVPIEFRGDFDRDIISALREIAGVSTIARHPYIMDVEAVAQSIGCIPSIFNREDVDFVETALEAYPTRFVDPHLPRAVHIDLAITGDSAGVAIGTVTGFKKVSDAQSELGYMPNIRYDAILEVKPPKSGEILFWRIRNVLLHLREMGLNIRWVTLDSFQSRDTMQVLRQQAFITGLVSMDTSNDPYDCLKAALYAGRVQAPSHFKARKELVALERDVKTGKIDHPTNGSKDCADAMAGVAYVLTTRREVWTMYKIPVMSIPHGIRSLTDKEEKRMDRTSQQEALTAA